MKTLSTRMTSLLPILLLVITLMPSLPAWAASGNATEVVLDGTTFQQRWSKNGQNEYTPPAEADLQRWNDMLTINLAEQVKDGDQLAALANRVLGAYKLSGTVVRTNSRPLTETRLAEHFAAAVLGQPGYLEAVFARFVMVEGTGVIIVRSHRLYGADVAQPMADWLRQNGPHFEAALMDWDGIPSLDSIRALPQNP